MGKTSGPSITVVGHEEINRHLARVSAKAGGQVIRQSFRKALAPVKQRAVMLAPKKTGKLSRAIKVRAGKRSRNKIVMRVELGQGLFKGETFYGGFIERGFRHGSRKSVKAAKARGEGDSRSHVPGQFFMKRALDETGPAARDEAERLMLAELLNGK